MQVMSAQERRAYMEQAIENNGVVLYKGRTIGNKAHLPSLAELAQTSEEVDQALVAIEAQQKALALEEKRLRGLSSGQPLGAGDQITTTQRRAKTGDDKGDGKSEGAKTATDTQGQTPAKP